MKYLEINPAHSWAWYNLGLTIEPGQSLQVSGETISSPQQCYVKNLEINPDNFYAGHNLGFAFEPGQQFEILGETVSSRQECFVRALRLNPDDIDAWHALGIHLGIWYYEKSHRVNRGPATRPDPRTLIGREK